MEQLNTKQKVVIMFAIVSAMFFAAVNQTIVGTALPRIVADLGGVEYFNWVYTIFMLSSSISGILVGKLSDIYGRKIFLLAGITIFLIGSFLCGWSSSIIQLIIFRALQGLGGGMIISTAHASVGDLFSPRERGKWQGFLASGFGLASISGPTLGGFIVDSFNWNWVFWVFLPFGVISFLLIFWLLPQMSPKVKEPIDFLGSGTLTIVLISLLLTFSWGGVRYEWFSVEIMALVVVTVIFFLLFLKIERSIKSPVVPLNLFKNKIFTISNLAAFFTGAGMFGVMLYVPLFLQGVLGMSATASGFTIMPVMISMVISSTICGMVISRYGKYKFITLIGVASIALGMISISMMDSHSSIIGIVASLIIMGLGMGAAFPVFTLIVQNAVEHKVLGVATSTAQLARHLGSTIGVAVLGIVMNARLIQGFHSEKVNELLLRTSEHNQEIEKQMAKLQDPQTLVDPKSVAEIKSALPTELHELYGTAITELREILGYSISGALLTGTLLVICGFIIALFLNETSLKTTIDHQSINQRKERGTVDKNQ